MRHRQASRLLTRLFDGGLDPAQRAAFDAHLRGCEACRQRLEEHAAVEALVRLLPQALLPREPSSSAQRRLWGLARWSADPVATWRERFGLGAVGVGVAVVAAALWISVGAWGPGGNPGPLLALAQRVPDASSALPLGWR
jgi:anti-sigma factor RsiW